MTSLSENINKEYKEWKTIHNNLHTLHNEVCKSIDDDLYCLFPDVGYSITALFLSSFDSHFEKYGVNDEEIGILNTVYNYGSFQPRSDKFKKLCHRLVRLDYLYEEEYGFILTRMGEARVES